jgi:hypothetical protein
LGLAGAAGVVSPPFVAGSAPGKSSCPGSVLRFAAMMDQYARFKRLLNRCEREIV